jgi:nitrogen fixation protein FixH
VTATAYLPLPSDATMAALLALCTGEAIVLNRDTGQVAVELSPGTRAVVAGEHLDALFDRGWIEADDETMTLTTTEKGGYWLRRWLDKQRRKA